jgi:hypothetical protein
MRPSCGVWKEPKGFVAYGHVLLVFGCYLVWFFGDFLLYWPCPSKGLYESPRLLVLLVNIMIIFSSPAYPRKKTSPHKKKEDKNVKVVFLLTSMFLLLQTDSLLSFVSLY